MLRLRLSSAADTGVVKFGFVEVVALEEARSAEEGGDLRGLLAGEEEDGELGVVVVEGSEGVERAARAGSIMRLL